MHPLLEGFFRPYIGLDRLNIGCGPKPEPGWVNADLYGSPDVRFDLRRRWPFESASFDTVFSSHTLEHFSGDDLFHIMYESGRVLRQGGHLLALVPYGFSATHFSNPFHKQVWTEHTPHQFDRRLYEGGESHGMDQGVKLQHWSVVAVSLRPADEWRDHPQYEFARKHYLNVVEDMVFVMRRE